MTFGLKSYPPDLTMSSAPLLLGDFNPFVLVAARNKSEEWQSNCGFDDVCADLLPAKITGQLIMVISRIFLLVDIQTVNF